MVEPQGCVTYYYRGGSELGILFLATWQRTMLMSSMKLKYAHFICWETVSVLPLFMQACCGFGG